MEVQLCFENPAAKWLEKYQWLDCERTVQAIGLHHKLFRGSVCFIAE